MTEQNAILNDTSSREIVVSRTFNAPRELVFGAWTDPKHIDNWWGPRAFTTKTISMDVRPGGVWLFTMHGMGMDFPNKIVYEEVIYPEKLVYMHGSGEENDHGEFKVWVTFEAEGQKTKLTMRSLFKTAAERDKVVKEYGAMEGAHQTLDRLEEELAR